MKQWEELIRENVFRLGGHRDRLLACLAHMLYCVVAEEQYNLTYFFVKRIECAKATPTANLPYGMFLTRLYRYVMETYPHIDNDTYDIVEQVMRPLALRQTRRPRSDRGKACRSLSSSSSHHQGTSSHQHDDDDDVKTSRASTDMPYLPRWIRHIGCQNNDAIKATLFDVIKQPLPATLAADSEAQVLAQWNTVYDAYNKVACLILGSMTLELHRQFKNSLPYDMIKELKSMFEKQNRVKRNYNMHNMGKTLGELHALLIEYEKSLPKKAATPQVMAIQGGRIQKVNKKSQNAKDNGKVKGKGKDKSYILKPKNPKSSTKEHLRKDGARHHCKEVGNWKRNCPVYLAELIMKKKQVGTASSSVSKNDVLYFNAISSNGIYEIDMINRVPNVNSIYTISNKRSKHNLDSTYTWHCRLAHISKKRIEKLQHDGILKSSDEESFDKCVSCLSDMRQDKVLATSLPLRMIIVLTPPYTSQHNGVSKRRNYTLLNMVQSMMNLTTLPLSFWDYALETARRILNMVPTKKVDKTPYELWYVEFLEKNILSQKISERAKELEEIQNEDTPPYENTSEIPMEVEGFEPPQAEVVPIRRFARTHQVSDRLCLNVEVKEHSLGDLNEPTNYKAAILDPKSDKWVDDMNVEMQSMKDNQVWCLVDLLPNSKGFTQTYGVDYEETFSPVADIRAIRILIAIAVFYDYEIWQMDVKTSFLNGYLDEDIYMVQHEGFIDPNNLRKVCKLQMSIYGLKKVLISWNKRFDKKIKRFGFTQNLDDPCVYQTASGSNVTVLILYFDDIIIMENHISSLQSVKTYLGKCFAMKDLGEATFIIGIKIYLDRSKQLIRLSQSDYMDKILKRYMMDNSKQAENIAALEDLMEAFWIRKFISGFGIIPTINEPTKMFCDNSAALHFTNEPRVQKGVKHYHRRYLYVRECIELGKIKLLKVHTDDNLAGLFTKALSKGKLTQHARSMRLRLASCIM
uniref:Retrotransposon protein, putative, Ty1-copia subclass n=1 Tax=Tanacetum cinerariifolium TaxID=118510 RepID=A0A699H5Y8_TANCI|nr:hypothetical protein [Tanacetum cinerariifolium]